MKIVDCFWEKVNLGKRTTEITVEESDSFSDDLLNKLIDGYEYLVVKIPMNMPSFNIGLSNMGFICIETQMIVRKAYQDFDFDKLAALYNRTSYEVVDTESSFNSVLESITPGMFSTDRISLDPIFGEAIACLRYKNWMTTEYRNGKSSLIRVLFGGKHIGFMLIRVENDEIQLLLNGIYKPFQHHGLGLLTPGTPLMYAHKEMLNVSDEVTSISSNNIPVVKLYNRLGFQLDRQYYVFIKHQ